MLAGDRHPALGPSPRRDAAPVVRTCAIIAIALTVILAAIPGNDATRAEEPAEQPSTPAGNGFGFLPTASELDGLSGAAARAWIDAALRAWRFSLPADRGGGRHGDWVRIADLAGAHALAQQSAGDEDGAFETALGVIQLGQRIQHADGDLADWHRGATVQGRGLAAIHSLLRAARLSPRKAANLIDRLGVYRNDAEALRRAYAATQREFERRLDELAEGRLDPLALGLVAPSELPVDWQYTRLDVAATRATLARGIGLARRGVDAGSVARWQQVAADLAADREAVAHVSDARNLVGARLCRALFGATLSAPLRHARLHDTTLDAVRVLVALNAHRTTEQRLPRSLDGVSAFFAGRAPADAFADAPLRYDPERRLVYSVGVDCVDAGGSTATTVDKARTDVDEPTFWIEF
jgi:hypothetical protein